MRASLLACVSVCALSLAPIAAAKDGGKAGQCFDARGMPTGPIYEMSKPNHHWINWVQAKRGTCRPLYDNEVAFFAAQKRGYDPAYTPPAAMAPPNGKVQAVAPRKAAPPATAPSESGPPAKPVKPVMAQRMVPAVAPAARPSTAPAALPPNGWKGNSARAARMLATAYSANGRDRVIVVDTGRNIERSDGIWRVFQVRWADGVIVPVGVRVNIHGHMDFERITENYPTTRAISVAR